VNLKNHEQRRVINARHVICVQRHQYAMAKRKRLAAASPRTVMYGIYAAESEEISLLSMTSS
jgi:hypothetical protein